MKKLLALIFIFFSYSAFAAYDDCELKIVYLRTLPTSSDGNSLIHIAAAQLIAAQYLELMPDGMAIFSDNIQQDLSSDSLRQSMGDQNFNHVKEAFASGFPLRIEDATTDQRLLLADLGAEKIAIIMGSVPKIMKIEDGMDVKTQAQLDALALREIKNFFAQSHKTQAVLVSSSMADWSAYADIFPPKCMIIPPEIKEFFGSKSN